MSASPAVLAARLIEQQRRMDELLGRRPPPSPRYRCTSCDRATSTPSTTDASDFYPDIDGNLVYQHRHYLCCQTCFSTNLDLVAQ